MLTTTNTKSTSVISCLFLPALLGLIFHPATSAQENSSQRQKKSTQQLKLEYAQLNLKLKETELKLAEQYNQKYKDKAPTGLKGKNRKLTLEMALFSPVYLERLQSNVDIARNQLKSIQSQSTGSHEQLRKKYAEEKVRVAKMKLEALLKKSEKRLDVPKLEITRHQLEYQLAKLQLELMGNPEHLLTLVDSLQRQIDNLGATVIAQDQRMIDIEQRLLNH